MTTELAIPGYERPAQIGRGGFAVVYRAWQPAFDREVAIKILTATLDTDARLRFERECAAIGGLSGHPNIVTVYDHGISSDGRAYIVMEFLSGGSLAARLDRGGPLPWTTVCDLGVKLAGALESAHRRNVLHRDVKPDNVLVSRFDEVKLGDFGIARVGGKVETAEGIATATLAYAAPELLAGERPSIASDVYSLGATLCALLTGLPPFTRTGDENLVGMLSRIANDPAPSLQPFGVPQSVCGVIEQAMQKSPDARQPTVARLGRQLQAALAEAGFAVPSIPLEAGSALSMLAPEDDGAAPAGIALSGESPADSLDEPSTESGLEVAPAPSENGAAAAAAAVAVEAPATPPASQPAEPTPAAAPSKPPRRRLRPVAADTKGAKLKAPPGAAMLILAALVLIVLAFAVALTQGTEIESDGDIPAGTVTLNGVDPVTAKNVELDISQPIAVAGKSDTGLRRMRLDFSAMGIPLGYGVTDFTQAEDGSFNFTMDGTQSARFFVGGQVTAKLTLYQKRATPNDPGQSTFRKFALESNHSTFRTVPGAIALVLLLFLLAYVKSAIYWLVHGERRAFETTNLFIGGALTGITAVLIAWLLGGPEPAMRSMVTSGVLGAAAGVCAAVASLRFAQRQEAPQP